MKNKNFKKYINTLLFIVISISVCFGQPIPPSTPSGSPVPVEGIGLIVLTIAGGIILWKNKLKNKQ